MRQVNIQIIVTDYYTDEVIGKSDCRLFDSAYQELNKIESALDKEDEKVAVEEPENDNEE